MTDERRWYAGVDWASESHHVLLTDGDGRKIGEKIFKHGGEGLAEMAAWLMAMSGVAEPRQIDIAIEVPHGPVVETLIERSFKVHAINPKQMDRFRDRFTLAGAKDDSRDAEVMASALRTDPRCFRLLAVADPVVIELREWSRIAEDLGADRNRLTNRLREQLWRNNRPAGHVVRRAALFDESPFCNRRPRSIAKIWASRRWPTIRPIRCGGDKLLGLN